MCVCREATVGEGLKSCGNHVFTASLVVPVLRAVVPLPPSAPGTRQLELMRRYYRFSAELALPLEVPLAIPLIVANATVF